ncbi:hypothetical protein NEIPOLOT_01602 [Neisseria polysaccharea ATCC 43768]|nr:hypothetical protein NEIPOLOT_01602 [Neisseria polysaccharea ATCC 43768]
MRGILPRRREQGKTVQDAGRFFWFSENPYIKMHYPYPLPPLLKDIIKISI